MSDPLQGASSGSPSGASEKASQAASVAGDHAKDVASSAAQAGSDVASTAAQKAKDVVGTGQQEVSDLLGQVRGHLSEQAGAQHRTAVDSVNALVDELSRMVDGASERGETGPATAVVSQARDKASDLAGWLQARQPGDLVDELRGYARRKPGTFLLGAALAGVAMGRLTRGVQAAHSQGPSGGTPQQSGGYGTDAGYGSQYGAGYGSQYGSEYGSQYGSGSGSQYGSEYGSQYGAGYATGYGGGQPVQDTQYGAGYETTTGHNAGYATPPHGDPVIGQGTTPGALGSARPDADPDSIGYAAPPAQSPQTSPEALRSGVTR